MWPRTSVKAGTKVREYLALNLSMYPRTYVCNIPHHFITFFVSIAFAEFECEWVRHPPTTPATMTTTTTMTTTSLSDRGEAASTAASGTAWWPLRPAATSDAIDRGDAASTAASEAAIILWSEEAAPDDYDDDDDDDESDDSWTLR